MKIDADLNQILPAGWKSRSGMGKRLNISSGEVPVKTSSGLIRRGIDPSLAHLRETESRISEALSIAQMAHSVLQQAMVISSRLRSLAMDAITSNRVNADDLAAINTEMQTTLGEFAGRFNIVTIPPEIRNSGTEPVQIDINDDLKQLREAVATTNRGETGDPTRINEINTKLSTKSETLSGWIDNLSREGIKIAGDYSRGMSPSGLRGRVSATADLIRGNFNTALVAQGNLSGEKLTALIGG